jgi:uncharacterized protein (DUF302 family)
MGALEISIILESNIRTNSNSSGHQRHYNGVSLDNGIIEMKTNFGFGKPINANFDDAITQVTDELQKEGFGVLTEIDVAATLKKKLGEDMPPYKILGACNPPLAHQAVTAVPEIGLLLPCNVLVREDDTGQVHVSFMDPGAVLGLVDVPEVEPLAAEVKERLTRVMDNL